MRNLHDLPRVRLGVFPTPFYRLDRLSEQYGRGIWIKRDDLCGVALGGCLTFMDWLGANLFFKTIAGGAVSALLALLLTGVDLGQNSDFIIIGALMALVPGLIFTNAIRDIMAGDMVSGITKAAEALLIGVAIALGTGFVLSMARVLGGV